MEIVEVPFDPTGGRVDLNALRRLAGTDAALFVQQPNYFGVIEDLDTISRAAAGFGFRGIVVTDAISLGLLEPPGSSGCDVVAGRRSPSGIRPMPGARSWVSSA